MLLGASISVIAGSAAMAADFQVEMNKSKALHLQKPVATVMIGNPSVADVTIESGNLIYVMGKSYGRTNLVALNADGQPVLDMNVNVVAANSSAVTLTRGAGQLSYNCTPRCERIPNIGDSPDAFDEAVKQMTDMAKASGEAGAAGSSNAGGATLR
jgi:Flp pilus assembly secretin CpaC